MSNNIIHSSDDNFEADVLQADVPVIVDFWAEWCGPCKMIAPIFDELSQEYGDRVKFTKVNVDENAETPAKYGVKSIPSLLIFKDGNVVATKVGALSKSQLMAFIDENIK